ncbi:MAG: hypothetical protein M3N68_10720 [Actinomycetota bacterium]|nr:hypothetical protein [Actinomycetota bacterium]
MARRLSALLLFVTLVTAACGSDRTGGPRGDPEAIVRRAPDRTLAGGTVRVEAAAPGAQSRGRLRVTGGDDQLALAGLAADKAYPELAHPLAMVDLVRGAVAVEPYGGIAVRGVSTFRYETVLNVERAVLATPEQRRPRVVEVARTLGAPAFYADVWVDGQGRLRRVQVPVVKTTERPHTRDRRTPDLITVDFFDFEAA